MNQGGFPSQMNQPMGTQYLNKQSVQVQQQQQILRVQQPQQQQSDFIIGNGRLNLLQSGEEGKRTNKKTTLVSRMDELKNAPPEKHMYIFGMDIPQTGIANLNLDRQGTKLRVMNVYSSKWKQGFIYIEHMGGLFSGKQIESPSIKTDSLNFTIPQSYLKPQVTLNAALVKKLPEDTLFYIFYNFPEDTQQFTAVTALYERGWKYNQSQLSWMRNLEEISSGIFKGEYFNFTEWKIEKLNGFAINEADLVTVLDFEKQLSSSIGIQENTAMAANNKPQN